MHRISYITIRRHNKPDETKSLFKVFCDFSNLWSAWKKTRRGSGPTTAGTQFFADVETELLALRNELLTDYWQPRPYRFFDIYDPKHRTIAVSDYRDRVVHHALVNVLEPIYEKTFIADSFATRTGKGVHAAVFRAQHFLQHYPFFLKTDIEKFFDSVPHDALLSIIERKIKDRSLLLICEKIIRHGGLEGRGLPIGNRTSQFFANVCLDPLDHFIKDKLRTKGYVRYMDDFILFDHDPSHLKVLRTEIEQFLSEKLQLSLKPSATFLNSHENGLSFLGRRIFPGLIRLRSENLRRITRRMDFLEQAMQLGDISEEQFLHSMNSYWAMLTYYPDCQGLCRRLAMNNVGPQALQ